jgi:hypothetical protein
MAISYFDAVNDGFPTVQSHCEGNPFDYNNLIWAGGDAIPSQDDLDAWIKAQSALLANSVTKYQFRKLFTMTERVGIDNVQANTAIPANYRAILLTMSKDMDLSAEIQLNNPDVSAGVGLLEQLGLIGPGRAAQILSNTPHA